MKFKNFSADKENNVISWRIDGELVSIECPDLDSAHLFTKVNLVIALVGQGSYPSKLIGFSEKGVRKFEVDAPKGFEFSYLTEHPTAGVAVVCVANQRIDGWMDWHFSVNPSTGELKRHCPAY